MRAKFYEFYRAKFFGEYIRYFRKITHDISILHFHLCIDPLAALVMVSGLVEAEP